MFAKIGQWWRRRQRSIDIATLWPTFKCVSGDDELARSGFYCHCMMDSAWTKDFSESEIVSFINKLE